MTWGFPPKHVAKKTVLSCPADKVFSKIRDVLNALDYEITNETNYTFDASKKLRMTFFSFFNFTRPKIVIHAMADEDRNLKLKMRYEYTDGFSSTFNDLGKLKKEAEIILKKMN